MHSFPRSPVVDRLPPERRLLRFAQFAGVAQAGFTMVVAFLASKVIASVFLDGGDLASVTPLLLLALLFVLGRAAAALAGGLLAQRAGSGVARAMRSDLTARLLSLGPAYAVRQQSGDIAGLLVGGMETVETYVTSYLPARNLAFVVPILVMVVVAIIDPPSVLVLLLTGPVLLLLLAVIGSRTRASTARRFEEVRYLGAFFLDMLRGLPTLKLFGRSEEQVETLGYVGRRYSDTTMDVLRTAFQTSLVLEFSAAVAMALVAVEVGLRLIADGIAFDRALAVLIITPEFFLPLRRLSTHYHEGSAGKAVLERADEILAMPAAAITRASTIEIAEDVPGAGESATAVAPSLVRLDGVNLTYPNRARPALDGVSLELPRGQIIALVGETGSGKSTVASLLLRFLDADSGRITADDRDISSIAIERWRASLAWVPQVPHFFSGSILENLRLARPGASLSDVADAAADAGIHDFIAGMPAGYDTTLGEDGVRLSGGQRQRIAIARALLRDAPILILDEATSHQDLRGEATVGASLRRQAPERITLVISHRLELVSLADQVVVLDRGRVVEAGIPADLAEDAGPYRRLLDARAEVGAS